MRKRVFDERGHGQAGRSQCFEDCQGGHFEDADWHAVLCESRGLAGQTLRQQVGYLVARLRPLRAGVPQPALHGQGHERSLSTSHERSLPEGPTALLFGSFRDLELAPLGRPKEAADLRADTPHAHLHPKAQRAQAAGAGTVRRRGRPVQQDIRHAGHDKGADQPETDRAKLAEKPIRRRQKKGQVEEKFKP